MTPFAQLEKSAVFPGIMTALRAARRTGAGRMLKNVGSKVSEFGRGAVGAPVRFFDDMFSGNMPTEIAAKTRAGRAGEIFGMGSVAASPFVLGANMMPKKDKDQPGQPEVASNAGRLGAVHPDVKKQWEAQGMPNGPGFARYNAIHPDARSNGRTPFTIDGRPVNDPKGILRDALNAGRSAGDLSSF